MIGKIRCKSEFHARQIEKYAHNLFYKQRRRGEWFKLSENVMQQLYSLIQRTSQQTLSPEIPRQTEEIERQLDRLIPWDSYDRF
jgi:hypothetical protein